MLLVPKDFASFLTIFALLFPPRVWPHGQVMLVGAILAPGKRTVIAALRVMGLAHVKSLQQDHRVLNRSVWSSLEGSPLLVHTLSPTGPVVMGWDDPIVRRRGAQIRAQGMYRDPVRSSHSHVVKASGVRWLSLMRLGPRPWGKRVWALPLLTGLAPAARDHQERGQRQKQLTDWARHMRLMVRRWCRRAPWCWSPRAVSPSWPGCGG